MLLANVPENNAPNHPPWADGNDVPFSMEGMEDLEGDLLIDVDSFFAVLNEEPGCNAHSQSSQAEGSSQGNVGAGNVHFGRAVQLQDGFPESLVGVLMKDGGLELTQLSRSENLDSLDSKMLFEMDYLCEAPGSYDGSLYNSVLTGGKVPCSQPANLESDWLRSRFSSAECNTFVGDSAGGSVDSLMNIDYQRLQTEVAQCSSPSEFCAFESICEPQWADCASSILPGSIEGQEPGQMGGYSYLEAESPKGTDFASCTNNLLQHNGEMTGSSEFMSDEYGLGGVVHNSTCTNDRMDTETRVGNMHPAVHPDFDPDANDGPFARNTSRQIFPSKYSQMFMSSEMQRAIHVKDGREDKLHAPQSISKVSKIEQGSLQGTYGDIDSEISIPSKKPKVYFKNEQEDQLPVSTNKQCHFIKEISKAFQKNRSIHSINVDDDADLCVLDDISAPSCPPRPVLPIKPNIPPRVGFGDLCHSGAGSSRLQADDERLTYRIALQDLAQPKSEASPPEGVLAVPLLRHQRIALSWMVQKETRSLHCSGGILADDQGLGKTVSTIALILKERSPQSKSCSPTVKGELEEALNLDADDELAELDVMKQLGNSEDLTMCRPANSDNTSVAVKGRPAAGTLIVCPTSVLHQWSEELKNKVTSKANLSFLVYHGANRTKDPIELAKYDVVLTTYSIVNLEVPKQALADKGDEEKEKPYATGLSMGSSTSKKRKNPSSSNSRRMKDKTGDRALLESAARPLARVGWFRVVLDEAQTIKNYRTQVARACWGLRAKRRWCLSGTPIQNAVDDLYSYFRFLRYDPYAAYNLFCSTIKLPISRHPATGYKKLQAVLRTIMLRRTKGTLIDGQPIINLPPRSVTLKRVAFSSEERAFYSRLEAESRETFKGYADAGTVKQNYVNILLMLLRLRQACDHPLLVRGYDSDSVWMSSLEAARKIPREKQIELLNLLEGCLAICTICNDPPEDAVVTICGHVFCNQCISEHLTGDDSHCPSAHCKVQLCHSSVFSKATLKSSLCGLPGHDCLEPLETAKSFGDDFTSDSSKIKAAVEILQSLPKLDDEGNANEGCARLPENMGNPTSIGSLDDKNCGGQSSLGKCSKVRASEKAIVFSQWTRMLDLLEVRLKSSCIRYRRLDGTMSVTARDKAIKDFNTLPEVTVMIMSLKAASLGLNLVSACHVLLLDLWWNPTTEDQAIDRAHRIGQTRPVIVSRLTVENTVEDRILALQEKKREMVASAFGEDESGTRQTRLTVEDLRYLFMV